MARQLLLVGHKQPVVDVCFCEDSAHGALFGSFLSVSLDGTARSWALGEHDDLGEIRAEMDKLIKKDPKFHKSRIQLLEGRASKMQAGRLLTILDHDCPVHAVAMGYGLGVYVTAAADGKVRVCSLSSGMCIQTLGRSSLQRHRGAATLCKFHPDGRFVARSVFITEAAAHMLKT